MNEEIIAELRELDSLDDAHWTQDGLPNLNVLKERLKKQVTRQEVTDAAPLFSRTNLELPPKNEEPAEETKPQDSDVADFIQDYLSKDVMTETQFVDFMRNVPDEHLEALQEAVHEQVRVARNAANNAQKDLGDLNRISVQIDSLVFDKFPPMSNQEAIMQYLESQKEIRIRKAELRDEALRNLSLKDIDPRAPIDRAFQRKTQRGTKRPDYGSPK